MIQPDSLVPQPGNPLAWDRYAYTVNNPVKYNDPTGRTFCDFGYCPLYNDHKPVMQVSTSNYTPVQQYNKTVNGQPGYMACGIAAAVGGGASWEELSRAAIKNNYDFKLGMQPSQVVSTYRQVYGEYNVTVYDPFSMDDLYGSLKDGNVVIVDLLVTDVGGYHPSTDQSFSHFARAVGMDWRNKTVTLENTLPGDKFWVLSWSKFLDVTHNPEELADRKPEGLEEKRLEEKRIEGTSYWGVVIKPRVEVQP